MAQTLAPTTAEYGGDEVSALVLDPGTAHTRAGFAGEDVPKSVVSSYYGSTSKDPYIFGEGQMFRPVAGLEIKNPMGSDGCVEDWDAATKLWEYTITSRLTKPRPRNPLGRPSQEEGNEDEMQEDNAAEEDGDSIRNLLADHPLFMTEPSWNAGKNREKAIELAMEGWDAPAFFLGRNPVLTAFATGKPTALVIDVGASNTAVTPVHDGLMLRRGIQKSPLAGNYVSEQLRLLFDSQDPRIPLHPRYMISRKTPVEAGQPSQASYHTFDATNEPHSSFRRWSEEHVLHEFKESVIQVYPGPGRLLGHAQNGGINEDNVHTQPGRPFEFPDGYNQMFGAERYRVVESLFDATAALTAPGVDPPKTADTISACVQAALAQVDVDVRPHMLHNVVVTGGTSLITGFNERLESELKTLFPGPKIRVIASGNWYERKFASWIGGSILASLGSFHQMWISRREYLEQGPGIIDKRCK